MTENFKDALKLNEDHPFNKPLSTRPRLLGQVPGMLMNLESDLVHASSTPWTGPWNAYELRIRPCPFYSSTYGRGGALEIWSGILPRVSCQEGYMEENCGRGEGYKDS
jgi:hypothetical protein